MSLMAKRLRDRGHLVMVFSYPTRSEGLDGHADELHRFIEKVEPQELHLAGHSLGGLVILNMLNRFQDLPAGRVVLMGTPVRGSSVARRLENLPGQKLMFGKVGEDLLRGFRNIPENRQTGMIRGTRPVGVGRLVVDHKEPSDGTVTESETQLNGLADSIDLPVSHTQMLLSTEVVNQLEQFVLTGNFNHKQ
jgi:pimeloyl-ACP methyl ester carboxylesterase